MTAIYVRCGLTRALAAEVAQQLTSKDALAAHARDELGIFKTDERPSAAGRSILRRVLFHRRGTPPAGRGVGAGVLCHCRSLWHLALVLMALGAISARTGGTALLPATLRVIVFGAAAMAVTASIGLLFHVQV